MSSVLPEPPRRPRAAAAFIVGTAGAGVPQPASAAGGFPLMLTLALTATDAAAWAGLITAAGGVIVSIIAALRGTTANAKADVLNNRADALASHAQSLDRQITAVAQGQPVPDLRPLTTTLPPGTNLQSGPPLVSHLVSSAPTQTPAGPPAPGTFVPIVTPAPPPIKP